MPNELWNEIIKRKPQDIEDIKDLYSKPINISITQDILVNRRQYFIKKVKAPLLNNILSIKRGHWWNKLRAFISAFSLIEKYPAPTKGNISETNTLVCLDIAEKFNKYYNNWMRKPLFNVVYRLFFGTTAHDLHYASVRDWWAEEIVKAILAGKWQLRQEGWPEKHYTQNPTVIELWTEPEPYGGKHSIIFKIREKRKEILELLDMKEKDLE